MKFPRIARSETCERILQHCVHAVLSTPAESDPFPHIQIKQFFPQDIYERALELLPDPRQYWGLNYGKPLTPGEEAVRYRFMFNRDGMQGLSGEKHDLWRAIRDALAAPELKQAVFTQLRAGLAFRYGIAEEEAKDVEGYPLPELFRETSGYSIPPHPDTRKKVVTMQIALPADDSQAELGTEFYKISLNPLHLMREPRGFVTVKRMPFLPNVAYAFTVLNTLTMRSWHGRSLLTSQSGVRNSILNIWYAKPDELYDDLLVQYGKEGCGKAA